MNPTHAGAAHWQEARFWLAMARRYPERRTYYWRLCREATADMVVAEGKTTTTQLRVRTQ
jgi:hypothetical protein